MKFLLPFLTAMLAVQSASAQSLWRNFFTTNRDPIVEVVAGSNATVQATTVGSNLRRFTVNSTATGSGTNSLVQTNISWTAVTNLQSAQVPYTVITNAPWQIGDADLTNWATLNTNVLSTLGQTNISYTAVTNAPWQIGDSDLTNWATLNTNVLSTLGQTNISYTAVTNAPWQVSSANLTNWSLVPTNYVPPNAGTSTYAALLTSTGIGLADTNWVLNEISALGAYIYFGGPTNSFAITNSGETVSRTNVFTGSISPFVNASTSSISGLTLNAYVRHVISTNTFSAIEAGPVSITTYPFRAGGAGTVSGHYEFYAVDSVSNIMYELGSTPTLTIAATAPTEIQTTVLLTNSFVATNLCYVAIAFKLDSIGSGGPTLSWAHGGAYGAHMTFVRPLSSATINWSQITGTPARSVGISVDGGGSAITAGTKGFISVPYAGTIQSCTLMASPSGSITFYLWRTNSADGSFPPTAVGAIGTNSLSSDVYNVDSTLTGWTTSLAAGDVLAFNIPSAATTITNCTLQLKIQP